MKYKWYPDDQIEKYLIVDLILTVLLIYGVLTADNPIGLVGSFLLLGLFLFAFYVSLWFRDWRMLGSTLLGCAVISVFVMFYNENLVYFAFIFSDLLGRVRSKTHMVIGMFGFIVMYVGTHMYLRGDWTSFFGTTHFPILVLLVLLPIAIHMKERSKLLRQELATANEKLEKYIQEEERHRIARDLHDTLGQTLTMITLKSELAIRLIDKNTEQAKREMNEVMGTSRFALKQVRELVTSMKFVSLEEEMEHTAKFLDSSGIHLSLGKSSSTPKLSKVAETMLALSLREAITNVIKHSKAQHCRITSEYTDDWYYIHIEDDGIGFEQGGMEGNGLNSIQERIRLLKGHTNIAASSNGGVMVTLSVPVDQQERIDSK
ncbi:sensor histidine kinase [Risungbinella massiliensis]|uniref:sensor histidine kinase n=1 Tax=Risungbinella massiliensis TaxID=1329796 RepID=UPI0005CBA64C|nr:sensor histidine kinase [Risungbinella massiliensis]